MAPKMKRRFLNEEKKNPGVTTKGLETLFGPADESNSQKASNRAKTSAAAHLRPAIKDPWKSIETLGKCFVVA